MSLKGADEKMCRIRVAKI